VTGFDLLSGTKRKFPPEEMVQTARTLCITNFHWDNLQWDAQRPAIVAKFWSQVSHLQQISACSAVRQTSVAGDGWGHGDSRHELQHLHGPSRREWSTCLAMGFGNLLKMVRHICLTNVSMMSEALGPVFPLHSNCVTWSTKMSSKGRGCHEEHKRIHDNLAPALLFLCMCHKLLASLHQQFPTWHF